MNITEYNSTVDDYSDGIYRFILKNLRDPDKAKDIVQDTYEKLWLNAKSVQYKTAKSYLFTTAYHTMIDYIRKDKRTNEFQKSNPADTAHAEQYSDLHEVLNQAVSKLPEDQRSVILLRDYEGYSYSEIGEITGLNESQVKVYIYRARTFLKNYIGSMETVI